MTSSARGVVQVFFDRGPGFREEDSSFHLIEANQPPQTLRFPLPDGTFSKLRFDPLNGPGTIRISEIEIRGILGELIRTVPLGALQPSRQIASLEINAGVAEIVIPPDAVDPIAEIALAPQLELRLTGLGRWAWPVALGGVFFAASCTLLALVVSKEAKLKPWRAFWVARPRRAIAGLALVAVVTSCYPVVFCGKSFLSPNNALTLLYDWYPTVPGYQDTTLENSDGSDISAVMFSHWPQSTVLHRALFVDREWPLWNRYVTAGAPLLGQGITTFGDPLQLPALLFDGAVWAWDFHYVSAKWLFAFGLGLAVWAWVGSLPAALAVAASVPFIGFFAMRFNHPAFFSLCYAPWLLVCWQGVARAPNGRWLAGSGGGLVLTNFALLNCGALKEALMQMVVLNGCGAAIVWLTGGVLRTRIKKLTFAAIAGAGFVLLSAPVWLTFLFTLRKSWTAYDIPRAWQISPAYLIGLFDDIFYRRLISSGVNWNPALNFFLLAGVLWALVSVGALWRDRIFRVVVLGAAMALALAFGLVPAAWIASVPFVANVIHIDNVFSCVALVLLAIIAGFGFREMFDSASAAKRWWWRYAGVQLLLLFLVVAYFVRTHQVAATLPFRLYVPFVVTACAVLPLLGRLYATRPAWRAGCVIWLVTVFVVAHARHGQHLLGAFDDEVVNPQVRTDLKAASPAVEFVHAQSAEPSRTIGLGWKLYAGYHQALLLEGPFGIDPLRNIHYFELDRALGIERITNHYATTAEETLAADKRAYDFLNVRYYFGDPAGAPPAGSGLRVAGRFDLAVFVSEECWPRAFFTDALVTYRDARAFAALVKSGDGQPFAAIQEVDRERAGPGPAALLNRPLSARTIAAARNYRLTSNTTSFDVEATGPGIVALHETFLRKDFRVTLNGQPAICLRINHAFKGVHIPAAGSYRVSFEYWPAEFSLALRLAGSGLVLLLAGGAAGWRMRL